MIKIERRSRFGMLEVYNSYHWGEPIEVYDCKCDCNLKIPVFPVLACDLRSGLTTSCGCTSVRRPIRDGIPVRAPRNPEVEVKTDLKRQPRGPAKIAAAAQRLAERQRRDLAEAQDLAEDARCLALLAPTVYSAELLAEVDAYHGQGQVSPEALAIWVRTQEGVIHTIHANRAARLEYQRVYQRAYYERNKLNP